VRVFITGTAGFIGFHLARLLLEEGLVVHGYDGMTDYYDVSLKRARLDLLNAYPNFCMTEFLLENDVSLQKALDDSEPDVVIHLAAQAGVRYSIENPRAYVDANIVGTFNILEGARRLQVSHLLMASTSSVYGANGMMPYKEIDKADSQMSFYATTKKATESMGHSYAHLFSIPTTMFRFFTVYGPWGRPDMALFKFAKSIVENKPIDIYNGGEMWRDFTYVDDLVRAIRLLVDVIPPVPGERLSEIEGDSLSPVAPYRVVNIGNSEKVKLLDFVEAIEDGLGRRAIRNYMPMQPGDVPATWADAGLLKKLTGYQPTMSVKDGVKEFIKWYRDFYDVK